MTRLVALSAAALAAVACATTTPDATSSTPELAAAPETETAEAVEDRDCFHVASVSGFTTVDDDTVRIDIGPTRAYELDAGGASCVNLRWANQIALDSGPSSSFLCVGDRLSTAKIHTDQGDECLIEAVRRADEPPLIGEGETAAELQPPYLGRASGQP